MSKFIGLAAKLILRSVLKYGLVRLFWTGLFLFDLLESCMALVMLDTKFVVSMLNSFALRLILR